MKKWSQDIVDELVDPESRVIFRVECGLLEWRFSTDRRMIIAVGKKDFTILKFVFKHRNYLVSIFKNFSLNYEIFEFTDFLTLWGRT